MCKYLIEYEDGESNIKIVESENFKDAIKSFANYTGDMSDLFDKALIGCDTLKDSIDMHNKFSPYYLITAVMIIDEILYDKYNNYSAVGDTNADKI